MADIYATIDGGTPEGGEQSLSGEMGDLLLLASSQLQDEEGVNWPPSKMLPYVNHAFLEIVNLKPNAYTTESVVQLVAGARQSLSSTSTISLLSAVCNMGTSGTVVGSTITTIKKKTLDQVLPDWMTYPADQTVRHVVKDDLTPHVFYTFPPQPSEDMNKIKLLLSVPVPEVTADTTDFPLDPSYKPAFIDYMKYICLHEETTIQNAQAKASACYNKFLQDLGLKINVEKQGA